MNCSNNDSAKLYFARYVCPNIIIMPTTNTFTRIEHFDRASSFTRVQNNEPVVTNNSSVLPEIQNKNMLTNGNISLNIENADSTGSVGYLNHLRSYELRDPRLRKRIYSQYHNNLATLTDSRIYNTDKISVLDMTSLNIDKERRNNNEIILQADKDKDKTSQIFSEREDSMKRLHDCHIDNSENSCNSNDNLKVVSNDDKISRKSQKRKIVTTEGTTNEKKTRLYTVNQELEPISATNPNNTNDYVASGSSSNSQLDDKTNSAKIKHNTLSEAQIRNLSPSELKRHLDYQRFLKKSSQETQNKEVEKTDIVLSNNDILKSNKNKVSHKHSIHRKQNEVKCVDNTEKPIKKHVSSTTLIEQDNEKKRSNKKATNKESEEIIKKKRLSDNLPSPLDVNKKERKAKEKSTPSLDVKEIKEVSKSPSAVFSDSKKRNIESNKTISYHLTYKKNKEIRKKKIEDYIELKKKKEKAQKAFIHLEYRNINKKSGRKQPLCSEDRKIKKDSNKPSYNNVQQKEKVQPNKEISKYRKEEKKECNEKTNTFLKCNKKNIKMADKTKSKQESNNTANTIVKPGQIETERTASTIGAVDAGKKPSTLRLPRKNCDKIDLRKMLIRKQTKNQYYSEQKHFKQYTSERDNLIITVKQDVLNSKLTKVTHTSRKPKDKKTKKMKFVINIECCSGESDDSDGQTKTKCTSPYQDLSFLDDFNVDEIVDSLNVDKSHKSDIEHVINTCIKKDRNKNVIAKSIDIKPRLLPKSNNSEEKETKCLNNKIVIEEKQTSHNNINVNDTNENIVSKQLYDDDVYEVIDITSNDENDKILIEDQVEDLIKQIFGSSDTDDVNREDLSNKNTKTESVIVDGDLQESIRNEPIPKFDDVNMQQEIKITGIGNVTIGSEPHAVTNKDVSVLKIEHKSPELIDQNTTLPVNTDLSDGKALLHVKHDEIQTTCKDSINSENYRTFQDVVVITNDAKNLTMIDKSKSVNNDLQQVTSVNSIKSDNDQLSRVATVLNHDNKFPDNDVVTSLTDLTNFVRNKVVYNATDVNSTHLTTNPELQKQLKKDQMQKVCEDLVKSEDNIAPQRLATLKCDVQTGALTNKDLISDDDEKIMTIDPKGNLGIKFSNNVEVLNGNQNIVSEAITDMEQPQINHAIINRNPEKSIATLEVQNIEVPDSGLNIKISDENIDSKTKNDVNSDEQVKNGVESCETLVVNNPICGTKVANETNNSVCATKEENYFKNGNKCSTHEKPNTVSDIDNLNKPENKTSETAEPTIEALSVIVSNDNITSQELVAEKSLEESEQTTNDVLDEHRISSSIMNNENITEIQERILQTLNKKIKITELIHRGYYSNIYKYKNEKGDSFSIKIIRNNIIKSMAYRNRMTLIKNLGGNNSSPLMEIMNTVYIGKEYFVLTDFYPKNLEIALLENKKCFHIDLVQKLAKQLVSAVTMLANIQIIHADIKPSHILLNSTNDQLKLCGFERSDYSYKIKILPCLGTVNYRAPETILGFFSSCGIDVWSTALVIFEMATGIKLFPGQFNNDILFKQLSTLDNFSFDILESCVYAKQHFCGKIFMRQYHKQKWTAVSFFTCNNKLQNSLFVSYNRDWRNGMQDVQIIKDLNKIDMLYKLLRQMLVMDPRNRIPINFVAVNEFILNKGN